MIVMNVQYPCAAGGKATTIFSPLVRFIFLLNNHDPAILTYVITIVSLPLVAYVQTVNALLRRIVTEPTGIFFARALAYSSTGS